MSPRHRRCFALGALALCLGAGCDEVEWPGPEYIDSLRVLGVRAEPPTLTPGGSTRLSMICVDGSKGASEEPTCNAEIAWFAQCNNPPGNDPDECLSRYAKWAERLAPHVADTSEEALPSDFGVGKDFDFSAPDDILSQALDLDGDTVRFGTSYVFFAVCAGELAARRDARERLPVVCRDRKTGKALDHRRFVVGVTTLYSYDRVTSRNPVLLSPRFDHGKTGGACASTDDCSSGFECADRSQCVPAVERCAEDDADRCEEHCLSFALGLDSFGLFSADGTRLEAPRESLWLDYFTNVGNLPNDDGNFAVRAPADASTTKRTDCVRWQAPRTRTEHAHLWAVVRDSRGGLAFWDQRILVR